MGQLVLNEKIVEWDEVRNAFIVKTELIKKIAKEKIMEYIAKVGEKGIKIKSEFLVAEIISWIIENAGRCYYKIKAGEEKEKVINELNSFLLRKIESCFESEELIRKIVEEMEKIEKMII